MNNSERQFFAIFIKYIHVLRDWECTLRENVDQYAEKAHTLTLIFTLNVV